MFSTVKRVIMRTYLGAALDSTGFNDAGGACRGAAGLFKKPQKNSRKRRKLRTSGLKNPLTFSIRFLLGEENGKAAGSCGCLARG